jgi:hypothetical protein
LSPDDDISFSLENLGIRRRSRLPPRANRCLSTLSNDDLGRNARRLNVRNLRRLSFLALPERQSLKFADDFYFRN